MSYKAARIRPGPRPLSAHVDKLAEAVTETWYGHHGSGHLEIPVSVVAALSLIEPPFAERNEFAAQLINLDPDPFADLIRNLWRFYINCRPDLVNRVWPLVEPWYSKNHPASPEAIRAAQAVGQKVLINDMFSLTGTEHRWEVDLLGTVLTFLRPKSSLQARGQFYTPGPLAEVMARMLGIADGESVHDPCCGTGGMLRAAAIEMRRAGRDPANCTWVGVDIDYLAVACCAVNVVTWGLGYQVLLGVGDSLKNDWWDRAIGERAETIAVARDVRMLAFLRGITSVVDQLATSDAGEADQAGDDDPAPAAGAEPGVELVDEPDPVPQPPAPAVDNEEELPPPPPVVDETPRVLGPGQHRRRKTDQIATGKW